LSYRDKHESGEEMGGRKGKNDSERKVKWKHQSGKCEKGEGQRECRGSGAPFSSNNLSALCTFGRECTEKVMRVYQVHGSFYSFAP
jgi:hypothetical protein